MIIKDKRGADPSVFTWIAAMLIIFFVLIIYLAATLALAGSDYIKGTLGNKLGVSSEIGDTSLMYFEKTTAFLNSNFDDKHKIKDVVKLWADKSNELPNSDKILRDSFWNFFKASSFDCYSLIIEPAGRETEGIIVSNVGVMKKPELKKRFDIFIVSDIGNRVRITFYGGNCATA